MTPFAIAFRSHRKRSGLGQKQLAGSLGLSVSLISSWETGLKAPPKSEVLQQLSTIFKLDDDESRRFRRAADESRPLLRVPRQTPAPGYRLAHRLVRQLPDLQPQQIDLICGILDLNHREIAMSP